MCVCVCVCVCANEGNTNVDLQSCVGIQPFLPADVPWKVPTSDNFFWTFPSQTFLPEKFPDKHPDTPDTARQHQRYGSVNLLFQTLSEDSSFLLLLAYQRIRGFAFMRFINPGLTVTLTFSGMCLSLLENAAIFCASSNFFKK